MCLRGAWGACHRYETNYSRSCSRVYSRQLHDTGNAIMNQIDQLTAIERIRNTKARCFR